MSEVCCAELSRKERMAKDEAKIVSVQRYVAQMLERLSKQSQDNVEAQTQVPMFTDIFFAK